MKIKYLVMALAATLAGSATLQAQSPEEIVDRMSAQMDRADAEGFTMDLVMKMPIVGEMRSHNLMRGDKTRSEINGNDKRSINWTDATTEWDYDLDTHVITISAKKITAGADDKSNLSSFGKLITGYDLTLKEETADAWYILCKKKKTNKDKDDPKKMDLAVVKATYLPLYLRMKKSIVSVGLENITIGVSEESVTFNPADFPNAQIVDKR